jgi:acetylornithine deacetylase
MPAALDMGEQRLVDAVAARADDLVALLCDLIGFDTTSRAAPGAPARDEAALQQHLGARLRSAGAEVDVWEPSPTDVADHPLCPAGGIGFAGRPQLAARFGGSGGGRSLLLNGHIDVVPARREDGWEQDPFAAQVSDGRVTGRGACDMKGGIAAMVVAA